MKDEYFRLWTYADNLSKDVSSTKAVKFWRMMGLLVKIDILSRNEKGYSMVKRYR